VIHPLTQFLIYYFVFAVIFKMRLGPEYGGTNYSLWLIAGLLPWMFFAESLTRAPGAVLEQANVVKKMVFPSEIFPIVHLTSAMINHLIGVTILILFLFIFGQGISMQIIMIFPYLFLMGIFILGISWILSAVNVFLRDIGQIISVIVNIWFFLTPVIYPANLIPKSLSGLFGLNPMFHIIEGYRMALLGKTELNMLGLVYLLLIGIVILAVGGLTFKKLKPAFADVL
jgi:ABC-type polysaccharide/polyol phosphate export permease